jgi:hypothetical protein
MTIINGTPAETPIEEPEVPLGEYGPKSVKTKEMEITQFSPMEVLRAREREATSWPTFCQGPSCVGRHVSENPRTY